MFALIMALHYVRPWYGWFVITMPVQNGHGHWGWTHGTPILPTVHGFLLMLVVFYAGFYALFGEKAKQ